MLIKIENYNTLCTFARILQNYVKGSEKGDRFGLFHPLFRKGLRNLKAAVLPRQPDSDDGRFYDKLSLFKTVVMELFDGYPRLPAKDLLCQEFT